MSLENIKVGRAAKWSLATEAISRVIIPVTQLVLARILAPEAFGVLATVVMIVSFAEMLADAGFQKYLVQYEFSDKEALYRAASVAFWSSMAVATVLLVVIILCRDGLAAMVGAPGLGVPVAVASLSLPLSVFVSTQLALFRRAFEYKRLLPVRIAVALVPLIVAVPLALVGLDFWALIIGVIASNVVNAVALTVISPWKPRMIFSFAILRKMISFSSWSLLEALSIWATTWAGVFIVGSLLTSRELGLYQQPILVVTSAFAIVTNATTPILFAALSRLQADRGQFRRFFLQFQFAVSMAVLPVGVGAFFYREFFTEVLFGPQWAAASLMFGAWALTTGLNIVFAHYCSEIFRALGRPRISFLSQCLYMAVMIPTVYVAALDGFGTLVIVSAAVRVVAIAISQSLAYLVAAIGFIQVFKNLYAPLMASGMMALAAWWLSGLADGHWGWSLLGVLGCAIVYALACLCLPRTRVLILDSVKDALKRSGQAS